MRKKTQPWDAVLNRIRVVWHPDKVYAPKATPSELDAIEVELGFQFPLSYRAFAERFGLGGALSVSPVLEISITILPLRQSASEKPEFWNSVVSRTIGARQYYSHSDQLPLLDRRSRPQPSPLAGQQHDLPRSAKPTTDFVGFTAFAGDDDEGVGTFLFQPSEITEARYRECRIFALNSARALRPVAESFWQWLEWVERSYRFPPRGDEEGPARVADEMRTVSKPDAPNATMQFKRAWIRDKTQLTKQNLKRWLAWNNHTARDLALSIRNVGRIDAFPVLADALQEAGCTNADLLDACRSGDPDIDGAWALQVLLGKA